MITIYYIFDKVRKCKESLDYERMEVERETCN